MAYTPKKPEDMIPDDKDSMITESGIVGRKGTMAAALANAAIVEAADATKDERLAALEAIRSIAPALKALGVTKFLKWKNKDIQALFNEAIVKKVAKGVAENSGD